jgi:hypothetical protein
LILRRAIFLACGVSALAAAAGVAVIALAFALYSALEPAFGPALAAAGVAGACLLTLLLGGLIALAAALPKAQPVKSGPEDLATRTLGLARESPLIAVAALAVVGFLAARNPKITASLIGAFLGNRPTGKR